jgi:GTP pyrophosphokinase
MVEQEARRSTSSGTAGFRGTLFRASVEVVALGRSKLLRDVASSLSEAARVSSPAAPPTPAATGWRVRSSSRWPTLASRVRACNTIKQIDGIYDAYRLVPGKGGSIEVRCVPSAHDRRATTDRGSDPAR